MYESARFVPGDGGQVMMDVLDPTTVDQRAADARRYADPQVAEVWERTLAVAGGDPPPMGLAAGERPSADVDVLAGAAAAAEYALASRMHAAHSAGCLPLPGPGEMLAARGWSPNAARRLARCGALAAAHPDVARPWAAGLITAEHVDPVARTADRFTAEELSAILAELGPHWGSWSPRMIGALLSRADRLLHPPPDPEPEEAMEHEERHLSFSLTGGSVLIAGQLPRVEGETVIAAIEALAERLRSTADHVPAGARRADALVQLVNDAHASDTLPTRGGLPVSLNVTLEHTSTGDPVWTTGRGHHLTDAEARWACCDAAVTPILVDTGDCSTHLSRGAGEPGCPAAGPGHQPPAATAHHDPAEPGSVPGTSAEGPVGWSSSAEAPTGTQTSPAARIAALASLMFQTRLPLAVGRTQRTATSAQRRALAIRDRGCVIPGCGIPAEACQTHHLIDWARGGTTDLPEMVLLCWAHHRQVDLNMWTIQPRGASEPVAMPDPGAAPGTPWPANNGAPWIIRRTPRHVWRT